MTKPLALFLMGPTASGKCGDVMVEQVLVSLSKINK